MEKKPVHYLTIDDDQAGQRIDNFLMTYLKNMPKTHIYRILRKGEIRVNKKRAQPSYRLQPNDQIRLPPMELSEDAPKMPPSQQWMRELAKRILFENEQLFIIDKPAGLPVHGGHHVKCGVIELLRTMHPEWPHLELAHRLDADTSGCLIVTKKRSVLRAIHELFREGKVRKVYWALTEGHWRPHELRVEAHLQKGQLKGGERIVKVDAEGRPSATQFRPLQSYAGATWVEATLETGRTHQIRVHAQFRGHPIAGDEKYGNKIFNKKMRAVGVKRLFLHAYLLELTLPGASEPIRVEAPLAPDLAASLKALE